MKRCIIFIIIFISLQYSIVYGQFKAVHIPDSLLVKMKIDGDMSDWNWVPKKYFITERSMVRNNIASNNFGTCEMIVGWSDLNNKLYIAAKVTDDIFITTNSKYYTNDCFQFAINPDNKGGHFEKIQDLRAKNSFLCALVPSDKDFKLLINKGAKWMQDKKYIDWNVKYSKNENGGYDMIYEICLRLWEKWDNESPESSSSAKLYPFKRIRLALVVNDSDAHDDTFSEWANLAGIDWWKNADDIPVFILDTPFKTGVSLQGIRYVLGQ